MRPASLPALTGVRFVAAALVLGSHFAPQGAVPAAYGPAAVTFFFVLSGVILTYTAPERLRARAFYVARFARIYPAYLLGLLPLLLLMAVHAPTLAPTVTCPAPPDAVLPDLLLGQALDPRTMACLNTPAWSVSCEMVFYALFPLLLPLVRRQGTRTAVTALVGLWLLALALPLLFLLHNPGGWDGSLLYRMLRWSPAVRLLDFGAGMVLGQLWLRGLRLPRPGLWALGAALALPPLGGLVPADLGYVPVQDALLWPALCLLLVALAQGGAGLSWVLARPVVVALGEASYALYILHWPLHTLLVTLGLLGGGGTDAIGGWPAFGAFGALAVSLSLLCGVWVERPARRFLLRVLNSRTKQDQQVALVPRAA